MKPQVDPRNHERRNSLRKRDRGYAAFGSYFITFCTEGRACFLGNVWDDAFHPSASGRVVVEELLVLEAQFPTMRLRRWVVMPNHVHLLLSVVTPGGPVIGRAVAHLKSRTRGRIATIRRVPGAKVWQRGYHDHVIRDDEEYARIANYIRDNPRTWSRDCLHG